LYKVGRERQMSYHFVQSGYRDRNETTFCTKWAQREREKWDTILYKSGYTETNKYHFVQSGYREKKMRYHSAQSGYTDRNDAQFPTHNLHSYHFEQSERRPVC